MIQLGIINCLYMLSHSWHVTTKIVYFYNFKSLVKLIIPKSTKPFLFKEGKKKIAWLLLSFWSLPRKAEGQFLPFSSPSLPPLASVFLKWALMALELHWSRGGPGASLRGGGPFVHQPGFTLSHVTVCFGLTKALNVYSLSLSDPSYTQDSRMPPPPPLAASQLSPFSFPW